MAVQLENDLFIRACFCRETDRTPVWLMRQAGRYLPEYRKTRSKAGSFLDLAKNPDFATEVTLQPIDRFDLDAAILFSDILTIPDAMGLELSFENGDGPRFAKPLSSEHEVKQLRSADMEQLQYVFDAVSSIAKALTSNGKQQVPLIGFSGSPWTLACYMIEGSGSRDFSLAKKMLYERPDLLKKILDINIQSVSEYLRLQIDAGAQAVMIFDTWGGLLTSEDYLQYSLGPMSKIVKDIRSNPKYDPVPIILFTKGGGIWLSDIANSGADVLGIDWTINLARARGLINHASSRHIAIQGNLDPSILLSNPQEIEKRVQQCFEDLSTVKVLEGSPLDGHIFNLGHGISQFTPPENVAALVSKVRQCSADLRLAKV
ncbi:uroporphyrinogen decarboxylase [Polynucleobacter wuianus]|uniref:Uroporphyrinogen decarboxylase n=1 Tax=Polynucleobacter wuianus TaxID=1743168 RepID=A0A191UGT6_9BURK|nr:MULTISPECIES: uroporphyrinogen decarboxylase [Polynucleobacter]ANJ00111.1 uroporphyrinogen decarboxylase [Polynucleobacter wuianus]MBU3553550.1 uroporphyrinogen decarboxylase [Polynucleobacter sp. MWH-Post4-6-1]